MLDDPAMRERLASAMFHAQSGQRDLARQELTAAFDDLGENPSYARATAEYIRGVLAIVVGDYDDGLRAIESCIAVATAIGEPGWESNARSLRVVIHARMAAGDDSLHDLVRAEHTLAACTDPELVAWGHTGLGYAYQVLRLYELALPHQECAVAHEADVVGLVESHTIDWLNLAESNLRLMQELEQLADPRHADQIDWCRRRAANAARTALDRGAQAGVFRRWTVGGQLSLAIAEWADDPAGAVDRFATLVRASSELGLGQDSVIAGCGLARAQAAADDLSSALATIEQVVDQSEATALDPDVTTSVYWTAVELAAAAGLPGGIAGRRYSISVARRSWAERERSLYAVQNALALAQLADEHQRERIAARLDPLTGIGNRRAFDEWLGHAADSGWPVTLVSIDVDDFKAVNDTHGHVYGDEVLIGVARALAPFAGDTGLLARIGGDEFVLLSNDDDAGSGVMPTAAGPNADDIAADVRSRLRTPIDDVAVSVGVARTGEGLAFDVLLSVADSRMYADKRRHSSLV